MQPVLPDSGGGLPLQEEPVWLPVSGELLQVFFRELQVFRRGLQAFCRKGQVRLFAQGPALLQAVFQVPAGQTAARDFLQVFSLAPAAFLPVQVWLLFSEGLAFSHLPVFCLS